MTFRLYGIANCDTVRKARAWLHASGLACVFHDYRAEGLDPDRLARWMREAGWEALLNRRSAAYRALPETERQDLDGEKAKRLMLDDPTIIRRPVLEAGERLLVGFVEKDYRALRR